MMNIVVRRIVCGGVTLLLTLVAIRPSFVLAANSSLFFTAQYRQHQPVTLDLSLSRDISTLDPTRSDASDAVTPIENLFLRLTDHDPINNAIIPELAREWSISDDGLVWTFYLRDDVNWMRYDPENGQASVVRPVVAHDFVYGIKRACDSRLGGYYGTVISNVIAGCDVVNQMEEEDVTDLVVFGDTVQVVAVDDTTLQITLQRPAAYFLSITTLWVMAAVPSEIIEAYGDDWTLAENIVTNGPYFLHDNIEGVRRSFVRNEALASDLPYMDGNIGVVNIHIVEESSTAFALYQANMLDRSSVPSASQRGVLEDFGAEIQALQNDPVYSRELRMEYEPTVFYFAFTYWGRPFNNIHVRRAFSAIIDRERFVEEIVDWRGTPMIHFTPPGMLNAPAIDEVGVGFDPEYAREQLALGGYPNCEGFPEIEIEVYSMSREWADFWVELAVQHLGCDIERFIVEEQVFSVVLGGPFDTDVPIQAPDATTRGWAPDFPDAHNWIYEILHCEATIEGFESFRQCSEIDELMEQSALEHDPIRRAELYRDIEGALFGPQGEYPIAPIYVRTYYYLVKSWYTGPFETDGLFNGRHWGAYSIDIGAKLAAREN